MDNSIQFQLVKSAIFDCFSLPIYRNNVLILKYFRGISSGSGGSGPNYSEYSSPGKKSLASNVVPAHRSLHEDEVCQFPLYLDSQACNISNMSFPSPQYYLFAAEDGLSSGSRYDQDKYSNYPPNYKRRPEGMPPLSPGESHRHPEKLERNSQMDHGSLLKSKQKDGRPKEGHKSRQKVHSTSKPKKSQNRRQQLWARPLVQPLHPANQSRRRARFL